VIRRGRPGFVGPTALIAVVLLGGCVSKTVKRVNLTAAEHAEGEIPDDQLLNVDIAVFDPGTGDADPDEARERGVYPHVRAAEARFLPVELRDTLVRTGQWGAVRVVPEPLPSSEVLVTGEILRSDGAVLEVRIDAGDASGRRWIDRTYRESAAKLSYTDAAMSDVDPFQDLFNRIANDLLAARRDRSAEELREIRRLGFVRFAADLAPDAFDAYLERSGERVRLRGLPAEGDPNVVRVERIRERDFAVIDALDGHYGIFHGGMSRSYGEWRAASYREVVNLEKLEGEALKRGVLGAAGIAGGVAGIVVGAPGLQGAASGLGILGGTALLKSAWDKRGESRIHAEAVNELGASLEGEVEPRVVELEGETVTLRGSAEAQYDQWRRLLREIYVRETGFSVSEAGAPGG
jgi:hypothetical protein